MAILQQYYTSFVNQESGRTGFQVKAMSEEISPETQGMLSRLIAYRIPTDIDERAIERHPVALRYYYHNEQESILLCSQSCGSDENGRPGNFFAHSLVMSPRSFTYQPPILYWQSGFWHKQVGGANVLIPLAERNMVPAPNIIEQMWKFLEDEGRQKAFQKLMCAVVHSKKTNRRIIILDRVEHIALWITAISCMLPPAYRPFLSFSTYNHEPYQSWFLITGTTEAMAIHSIAERNSSHFILDGRTNQTSEVEASSYASLVKSLCNQRSYRKILLQHFAECEKRFPEPTDLDDSLEMVAEYIHLRAHKEVTLNSALLPMIKTVLSSFERMAEYDEEDKQELEDWIEFLDHAREESKNPEIQTAYNSVIRCYHKHHLPTDTLLAKELKHYTNLLLQPEEKERALRSLQEIREAYGETVLLGFANQPAYVLFLVKRAHDASAMQMQDIWTYLGAYLHPSEGYLSLLTRSIYLWSKLHQQNMGDTNFLVALRGGIEKRDREWFSLLNEKTLLSADILANFYYQWVCLFSLKERKEYRKIFTLVVPDLTYSEFRADMARAVQEQKIDVLRSWIHYTQQNELLSQASLVDETIQCLRQQMQGVPWQAVAGNILLSNELVPLLGQWEEILVQDFFASITLQYFAREYTELYIRYQQHAVFSERSRQILVGLVVLATSQITYEQALQVHHYLTSLSADTYFAEVDCFLAEFLKPELTAEQHQYLITALFFNKWARFFWNAYWKSLSIMLVRLQTIDLEFAVRLFSFWFALRPDQFVQADQAYVVQQFFLFLPLHLRSMQKFPEAASAFENMSSKAATAPWYRVIQELFIIRRKNLVEKGQEWIRSMQLRLPVNKNMTEEPAQKLMRTLDKLLQKGAVQKRHLHYIQVLYYETEQDLFWNSYVERVGAILRSGDALHVLEIFAFWFDSSYPHLSDEPYLAQSFLSKITIIFELAWKEYASQMQKCGQQIAAVMQTDRIEKKHPWYTLLQAYFAGEGMK